MQTYDQSDVLSFYTAPGVMTSAGRYAHLLDGLPGDIAELAAIAQGLVIHEHMVDGYGVTLTEEDRAAVHLRQVEKLLGAIVARDDRPLRIARTPAERTAGNCRQFTVLMTAMLRFQGRPARARCGFGNYFPSGQHEDHWVCEYWEPDEQRWILVDAQIDDRQLGWFPIDFDVTDVPRDRFVVAGQAWEQYRAGNADPSTFGLSLINEAGDWWIASNLMRDAQALVNVEMLPWDGWGAMPGPGDPITDELTGLFDKLAALTQSPDANLAELGRLCQTDDRLRVPEKVRNAARGADEPVLAG
jgi:Transglutaminase-like superfamily